MATASTVTWGGSVWLDISAVSLNAANVNLSSHAVYTAYLYGGDLNDGLTTQLFPQYCKDTPSPSCEIPFCRGSMGPAPPARACSAIFLLLAAVQTMSPLRLLCLEACMCYTTTFLHAPDTARNTMLSLLLDACAAVDGDNTAVGTYLLNTTDLSSCLGGTFVITAVFSDDSEFFGDSAGNTTITVLPNCPLVRPPHIAPSSTACMHGNVVRLLLAACHSVTYYKEAGGHGLSEYATR